MVGQPSGDRVLDLGLAFGGRLGRDSRRRHEGPGADSPHQRTRRPTSYRMRRPALGRPAGPAPSGRRPQTAVVRALSLMPPMLKCGHRGRKRRFHAKRHSAPAETALPLSARSDSAGEAKATSSVETRARESCDADPDRLAQQRTRHVEVDQGPPVADLAGHSRRYPNAVLALRTIRGTFGARLGARLDRQVEETRIATRLRREESNFHLRDQNPGCSSRAIEAARLQDQRRPAVVRSTPIRNGANNKSHVGKAFQLSGRHNVWDPFGTRRSIEHSGRRMRKPAVAGFL
jgi:hypothetical protein